MNKIATILKERQITPTKFKHLLFEKSGADYGLCRVSKIINGKLPNMTIKTEKILANTLFLTINDIID
jgi:hypothetical protein